MWDLSGLEQFKTAMWQLFKNICLSKAKAGSTVWYQVEIYP
jgi:hypothetical protein